MVCKLIYIGFNILGVHCIFHMIMNKMLLPCTSKKKFFTFSKSLLSYLSVNSPSILWNFPPFPHFIISVSQLMIPPSSSYQATQENYTGICWTSSFPLLLFLLMLYSWQSINFVLQFFTLLKFSFLQSKM